MIITNVSISTMAAPLGKPANGISKETLDSLTPKDVESFSFIVDHVIGEKKIKTNVFLPGSSRPKEEIMIAKAFESCTFKAVASCLAGIVRLTNHNWVVGCFGFNTSFRQCFSQYPTVVQRDGEKKEMIDKRINSQTIPSAPTSTSSTIGLGTSTRFLSKTGY